VGIRRLHNLAVPVNDLQRVQFDSCIRGAGLHLAKPSQDTYLLLSAPSSSSYQRSQSRWQTLSAAHRERQKRAIPAEWTLEPDRIEQLKHVGTKVEGRLIEADVVRESGLLTDADLAITQDFTAAELLKKMSSRDLTSLQVVEAFGKRAALAQQLASCSSGPLLSNERD
jgi:hypothetical protein